MCLKLYAPTKYYLYMTKTLTVPPK